MGTFLRTKKGVNVKAHKQGGGWTGYEYRRGSPGSINSWNMEAGNKSALKDRIANFQEIGLECPSGKGNGKARNLCMRLRLQGKSYPPK